MNKTSLFSQAWMSQLQHLINTDRELVSIGRLFDCTFVWKIGDLSYLFQIEHGKAVAIRRPTWNDHWDFSIEGPTGTWEKFVQPLPPPGYYDLLGIITRHSDCDLIGNRLKAMQHMRSLVRLFQLTREVEQQEGKA
jgi:hypothetical protein